MARQNIDSQFWNLKPARPSSPIDLVNGEGWVKYAIEYSDGRGPSYGDHHNTVLRSGRNAISRMLGNDLGTDFAFYVSRMDFGNSGTSGGSEKYVDAGRNGLFCGTAKVSKPVMPSFSTSTGSEVTFTSVITYDEGNGYNLNEMGLRMANGDYFSMTTFPDLGKTGLMQISWLWKIIVT